MAVLQFFLIVQDPMSKQIYIEDADKPVSMRKPSGEGMTAEQLLAEADAGVDEAQSEG